VKKTKKFRKLSDAPRLIPPVSSGRGKSRKEGAHIRTAVRRLLIQKLALIQPDMIDKDSEPYKNYQAVIRGVTADMGNRLTTVEQVLVQAFSAAT
jgi:hypothetical protein